MGKRGSRGEATVELLLCITFGVKGSDTGSGFRLRDNEKKADTEIFPPLPSAVLQSFGHFIRFTLHRDKKDTFDMS